MSDTSQAEIIYLVHREGLSSVFESQMLTPVVKLAEAGYPMQMAVFTPIGQFFRKEARERWRATLESANEVLEGRFTRLPSPPSRKGGLWDEASMLARWLRLKYKCEKNPHVVLHSSGARATRLALKAREQLPCLKVISRVSGLLYPEFLMRRGIPASGPVPPELKAEAEAKEEDQRVAIQQADALACVSDAMARYVQAEYDIDQKDIVVMPCCVDVDSFENGTAQRSTTRKTLGLADRFVVTYCGSVYPWQCPELCAKYFKLIQERVPSAYYLALTTNPDIMREVIRAEGISTDNSTVMSVPHTDIPNYLAAADISFLLRESSIVNEVASPIKFGEYMASGTPILISPGVGDYTALVEKERVGVVLPPDRPEEAIPLLTEFISAYQERPTEYRNRCEAVARDQLSWESHLGPIMKLYDRMLA